jgi:hypothetical protein
MKNFYDLPDTSTIYINFDIGVSMVNSSPVITISVNDKIIHNNPIVEPIKLVSEIDVRAPLKIDIRLSGNATDGEDTAIIINNISADGEELMPKYNYKATYNNDHDVNTPTSILEFNGTWTLDTNDPLLWWLHEVSGKGWLLKPSQYSNIKINTI